MVEVSKCKTIIETDKSILNPYGTTQALHEAFWRALLTDHDENDFTHPKNLHTSDYFTSIPLDWKLKRPVISATNSASWLRVKRQSMHFRQQFANFLKKTDQQIAGKDWTYFEVKGYNVPEINETHRNEDVLEDAFSSELAMEEMASSMRDTRQGLDPEEFQGFCEGLADLNVVAKGCKSMNETQETRSKLLDEAAMICALWGGGPHDLIKSPFNFSKIIPDPFHHMREDPIFEFTLVDMDSEPIVDTASIAEARWNRRSGQRKRYMKCEMQWDERGSPKYALGRRFIITGRGYMGLAPPSAQEGDVVAVLFGCNVPILLRPAPSKNGVFTVVGEVYVQGIMQGEVIEMWRKGGIDSKIITII